MPGVNHNNILYQSMHIEKCLPNYKLSLNIPMQSNKELVCFHMLFCCVLQEKELYEIWLSTWRVEEFYIFLCKIQEWLTNNQKFAFQYSNLVLRLINLKKRPNFIIEKLLLKQN